MNVAALADFLLKVGVILVEAVIMTAFVIIFAYICVGIITHNKEKKSRERPPKKIDHHQNPNSEPE